MASRAINSMKNSKAAGPVEIVIQMIRTASPLAVTEKTNLVNLIIKESYIAEKWNLSYVINFYKRKGEALERGSYRVLEMLWKVLKIMQHVIENIIKVQICIHYAVWF